MKYKVILFLLVYWILFFFGMPVSGQTTIASCPGFQVNNMLKPMSITECQMASAKTLIDLNRRYPEDWIKQYEEVIISTVHDGEVRKSYSEGVELTIEQRTNIRTSDVESPVTIKVRYWPNNNLRHNEVKELQFSIPREPDKTAQYPGGKEALLERIYQSAIVKIPAHTFKDYDLATVKFTINSEGIMENIHSNWPFKDVAVDSLLLLAFEEMPTWTPAEYSNGVKTKQDFVLTVGNMKNCMVNTLNINRRP